MQLLLPSQSRQLVVMNKTLIKIICDSNSNTGVVKKVILLTFKY